MLNSYITLTAFVLTQFPGENYKYLCGKRIGLYQGLLVYASGYAKYQLYYITNRPISQRKKQAQRDTGSAQFASISLCLLLSEGVG